VAPSSPDTDRRGGGHTDSRPRSSACRHGGSKSPILGPLALYAGVMNRTRYGITGLGMLGAAAAGVYLALLPAGLVTLVAGLFTAPHLIAPFPLCVLPGAAAGPVVAFVTRRAIKPRMDHRYLRFTVATAVSAPFYLAFGIAPDVVGQGGAQWMMGIALVCGAVALVVYYQWRKRLTLAHRARNATARVARQPAAVRY
jgi:hypothetical protein